MPPPFGQRITSNRTEADTCRQYVVPKLQAAGWETPGEATTTPRRIAGEHGREHGVVFVGDD